MVGRYVNAFRHKLKRIFDCTCDVYAKKEIKEDGIVVDEVEDVIINDLPCSIIYKANYTSDQSNTPTTLSKIKMLYISDETIPINSKIVVTNLEADLEIYKGASHSAIYDTHKEIELERLGRGDNEV